MANWKTVLDIKDAWKQAEDKEISTLNLSKTIRNELSRIRTHYFPDDPELDDIIESFNDLITEENDDPDDFDNVMEDLYNWADSGHNCWIKTF